ncbi:UNVERIFIED_CONTAM: hypothetical protein FKN15_007292 [Acipenser sinensis]
MLQMNSSQLLLLFALWSVLYSKTLGLPALGTYTTRLGNTMTLDGDSESDWAKDSSKHDSVPESYKLYYDLENAVASNNFLEEQIPVKRHSDSIFTDNYSRFRKQMAVKKYLNSVLTGKRSHEEMNPASLQEEATLSEPYSENYDADSVNELLSRLPLL